jgi:uncharacterized protein DUF5667
MNNIENILNSCLEELQQGKELDEVLSKFPNQTDELRPLLEAAVALCELPDPEISINLMMNAMAKMAIEEHQTEQRKYRFVSKPILLRVAASVLIIFFAGYGTIAASVNSLPGDLMYPVKIFTEKIRFFLAITAENKVELRIIYSEKRLKELVKKFNKGDGLDRHLLSAMLDEAKQALENGQKLPADDKVMVVSRITSLSHLQGATLKKLKKNATLEEKEILAKCADICTQRCGCGVNASPSCRSSYKAMSKCSGCN